MAREQAFEEASIALLLNYYHAHHMDKYDLVLSVHDAGSLNKTVNTTVTYLRNLTKKEHRELIASIEPDTLNYLSCVLCKGLAKSYKVN